MTRKHTPGPWRPQPQTFSVKAGQVGTVVYGNPDNPNREADARLIAASPDLLEACRAALDQMRSSDDFKIRRGHQAAALERAIAKAEGRS